MDKFHASDLCNASGGECGTDTTTNQAICFFQVGRQSSYCCRIEVYCLTIVASELLLDVEAVSHFLAVLLNLGELGLLLSGLFSAVIWLLPFCIVSASSVHLLVPHHQILGGKKQLTLKVAIDKLRKGGYDDVYKGKLLDGRLIAVKLLNETKGSNREEFINEVASISRTSHINIVSLVGYCFEGRKRALIYEHMPNGYLEKFLHNKKSQETNDDLEWKTMHKIAVQIA
ncbi:hypothetical protein TEA_005233 [Camellia sinensis var. sinensis]|uniref:Protein kinase domain-containing protein n=1 Tax=Camellia sinensis var. sinensis TaxID=542762 RepID=A0A4S4DTN6_CAMSN|nr:hypothetical protein TEA_005233 [Camellia sinensis var. sinensis]